MAKQIPTVEINGKVHQPVVLRVIEYDSDGTPRKFEIMKPGESFNIKYWLEKQMADPMPGVPQTEDGQPKPQFFVVWGQPDINQRRE